jgi:hypothetical protein
MNHFLHHKDRIHHLALELEKALFNKYMLSSNPTCTLHITKFLELEKAYKKCLAEVDGLGTKNTSQNIIGKQQPRNATGNLKSTSSIA